MTSLLTQSVTTPSANAHTVAVSGERGLSFKLKEEDRRYWETWGERNKMAIEEYNEKIRTQGVWGAQYRTFARDLG